MGLHAIPMGLRAAYRLMHRQTNAWLSDLEVTVDQFVLLALLDEGDRITQQQLAQRASSDPNTITAMLALLEERGFIRRDAHPSDGRARVVLLTALGRQKYDELARELRPLQERLRSLFSSEERAVFTEYLQRVSRAFGDPVTGTSEKSPARLGVRENQRFGERFGE